MADIEDPTNVKPISPKKACPKEAVSPTASRSQNRLQFENFRKERAPSIPNVTGFKAHPLLKLNEYAKNCSKSDEPESNCDFVVKQLEYNSQAVSASSISTETDTKTRQAKVVSLNRIEPMVVKVSNTKQNLIVKCREKKEEMLKENVKRKDSKERKDERIKKDNSGRNEKEKEINSKGKSKETKDKAEKTHSKHNNSKESKQAGLTRKSKSNKSKEKEKEKKKVTNKK